MSQMVEQLEFHTLSSNTSAFSPTLSDIDTGSIGTGRRQQVTERDELFYFHETDFISIQVRKTIGRLAWKGAHFQVATPG